MEVWRDVLLPQEVEVLVGTCLMELMGSLQGTHVDGAFGCAFFPPLAALQNRCFFSSKRQSSSFSTLLFGLQCWMCWATFRSVCTTFFRDHNDGRITRTVEQSKKVH